MEQVYLSLKRGVEGETETLKARFDELQARIIEADAKRDQVSEGHATRSKGQGWRAYGLQQVGW